MKKNLTLGSAAACLLLSALLTSCEKPVLEEPAANVVTADGKKQDDKDCKEDKSTQPG